MGFGNFSQPPNTPIPHQTSCFGFLPAWPIFLLKFPHIVVQFKPLLELRWVLFFKQGPCLIKLYLIKTQYKSDYAEQWNKILSPETNTIFIETIYNKRDIFLYMETCWFIKSYILAKKTIHLFRIKEMWTFLYTKRNLSLGNTCKYK